MEVSVLLGLFLQQIAFIIAPKFSNHYKSFIGLVWLDFFDFKSVV